jgi:tRNA G18 (ribose-2'-O)-methylase SpoU
MDVLLYRVGRNLNRAYRTCAAFGVQRLFLIGNNEDPSASWELRGNLFSARNLVEIVRQEELPILTSCCGLETYYDTPLSAVDWAGITAILIGGETAGLPRSIKPGVRAVIPILGHLPLTVEAALAIALYEWRRSCASVTRS